MNQNKPYVLNGVGINPPPKRPSPGPPGSSLKRRGNMYNYKAKITYVVDGDTLDVDLDLGFNVHTHQRLRFARIDAPERYTDAGKVVKAFVEQFEGCECIIKSDKVGKYGRYIAEIAIPSHGIENLSDLLVEKGMAIYKDY